MRNIVKNKAFRDNIIFLMASVIAFSVEPAIVRAQTDPYSPINFTQPLSLLRGSLSPISPNSVYLSHDDSCALVQKEFGWEKESCNFIENIVFGHLPGIDTLIIEKPNSEGYVKFDDWDNDNSKDEINEIWNEVVEGSKEQSTVLGYDVTPVKWAVYPKLDKKKSYMYYAILINWNGELVINAKATLFDRAGYVPFKIVPGKEDISEAELTRIVETTLQSYSPRQEQSYLDFKDGDKVAAAGALGVLATLVGVKYGKTIATGLVAMGLILAKKLWFLIFVPFVFLKNLIFRNKNSKN